MSIIVNSSPLISLALLDRLELLQLIFNEVILPESVCHEVVAFSKGKEEFNSLSKINMFKVMCVENIELKKSILLQLDEGEAEVITIAKDKNISLVCIDEFAGRQYARLLGLDVIGTLGILLIAKQKGYINEIKPLLEKLIRNNRYIRISLCNEVLRKANEIEMDL